MESETSVTIAEGDEYPHTALYFEVLMSQDGHFVSTILGIVAKDAIAAGRAAQEICPKGVAINIIKRGKVHN